jgi:hypothetical protein
VSCIEQFTVLTVDDCCDYQKEAGWFVWRVIVLLKQRGNDYSHCFWTPQL